jgi:hypothetical protein
MSPVRYELGFYIPEDGILHSHRSENLRSYIALTGWALYPIFNLISCEVRTSLFISQTAFFIDNAVETSNVT